MDFDPPSAMTRFGMFFLAGGVALIFALWGVLKWLDQPRKTVAGAEKPVVVAPSATPSVTPLPTTSAFQGVLKWFEQPRQTYVGTEKLPVALSSAMPSLATPTPAASPQ